jgi:hypothetical protein
MVVTASLVACGPSYQKLDVDKIQSVAVAIDDPEQRFCAYAPVALRAIVTYKDGKQARSRTPADAERGHLRTSEFAWSTSHGTVNDLAVLALPHDPLAWFAQPIEVAARVVARPELGGEAVVHPRFDCGGTVDLRGAAGARGGEAEDGGPGAPGPAVDVALAYLETEQSGRLVLVRVRRGDQAPEHFLVAAGPAQKPFVLDVSGGAGGAGGQGVAGLAGRPGLPGASGRDGAPCRDGGPGQDGTAGEPGGPGGPGANGGPGGPGGQVTVRYDRRFAELPDLVQVLVDGGAAGEAGPGGSGGQGGQGGGGGAGGKAGSTTAPDGTTDPSCTAADGAAGAAGAYGGDGPKGPDGAPGTPGGPGHVERSPADIAELFADEIARGVPVVTAGGGS